MKKIEKFFDLVLFVIFILPSIVLWVGGFFCSGINESSSTSGTCTIPILLPILNFVSSMSLIIVFGGFIIYFPIILISYLASTIFKIKGVVSNLRNKTHITKITFGGMVWFISTAIIIFIYIGLRSTVYR
jgi:hypothetical protein